MQSMYLGEYGTILFNQTLDITNADIYILYTKPDGDEGYWAAYKSGLSFFYNIEEEEIDQVGRWTLWLLGIWPDKLLWDRTSFRVKIAPIDRIPS
jgi:hypothetical protein